MNKTKPYISKEIWKKTFKDKVLSDCALREHRMIYLCGRDRALMEDPNTDPYDAIPTILIAIYVDMEDIVTHPYGTFGFDLSIFSSVGVSRKPLPQGLISCQSENGCVWPMGGGDWPVEYINEGEWPAYKLKCVLDYCYAIGVCREVYKRVEMGKWIKLDKGIGNNKSLAFKDIDAFTEKDMYAVGGDGEVWHYDGDSWEQYKFPSTEQLSTVVCALDGNVYIGGKDGNVWKGRENSWQKVYDGNFTVMWNEMRWFEDQLWLCSDYMLRILGNGELIVPQDAHGNQIVLEGHIDAYDGILAIVGQDQVHTFDGKTLRTIVAPYE